MNSRKGAKALRKTKTIAVLKELREINKSLENIEFDRYCQQCGRRSRNCKCAMTGLKWLFYNGNMRAYQLEA